MFKEGKYLIVLSHDFEIPILFHAILSHEECSPKYKQVVSAGFFRFYESGEVATYGESITLKLKSRKQDADIIQDTFFKEGE